MALVTSGSSGVSHVEGGKGTGAVVLRDSRHLRRILLGFEGATAEPILAAGRNVQHLERAAGAE